MQDAQARPLPLSRSTTWSSSSALSRLVCEVKVGCGATKQALTLSTPQLIAIRMEAYPCEENEVLQLLERVNEAGRIAQQELRNVPELTGGSGGGSSAGKKHFKKGKK